MITQTAILTLTLLFNLTSANAAEVISTEEVPVGLKKNAFQCRDAIEDHGFGARPATLSIEAKNIFDRTLRTQEINFYTSLPNSVTCADLKDVLSTIPTNLVAVRTVTRVNWTLQNRIHTGLSSKVTLELPLEVAGKALVLSGEKSWIENGNSTYTALTHPQSSTPWQGLHCTPSYENAREHQLTQGGLHLANRAINEANISMAGKSFPSAEACAEAKDELLKRFQAEDPGNHGTPMRVTRKLETKFRYIIDNRANQNCQRIQLETISIKLDDHKLIGVKTFPMATVELKNCDLK